MLKKNTFILSKQMIIDDREHDLIERLKSEKVPHQVKRLPVGDIQISNNGSVALIERKRTDDFASSISDGRWREQKSRLAASGAIVIYIIEGSLYGQSKGPETLSSAIWNTMLRDKMWVLQTRGLEDTSMHLQQLCKKIGTTIKGSSGLKSLLSKRKRKEDNVFQLMLMQITSESVASALIKKFSSLCVLQNVLVTNPSSLRDIRISSKRSIGPSTIKKLVAHLT
jgi:ERCC4-type nuclease